jgi:hypothetical protein
MSSTTNSDLLDILKSTSTNASPIPVVWSNKQNPFSNPPLAGGPFGDNGLATRYIHRASDHLVFQMPMFYYGSRAVCFKQFMECHTRAVGIFSTLLAMLCEMGFTAARRSQGLIPAKKDKKKKKRRGRGGRAPRQAEGIAESLEAAFGLEEGKQAMDEDEEQDDEVPMEDHDYPVVACLEEVYPPGDKPISPVAIRMHFFFKTKRTNCDRYLFEKIFHYELQKMELEPYPGKAARVFKEIGDIHKIPFSRYWDCVSAYTDKPVDATVRNLSPQLVTSHPLAFAGDKWHPYKTFTLERACNLAQIYGADEKYCTLANYFDSSNDFAFPEPKHVYLLDNDDLNPSTFFRLVFPCRRKLLGDVPPDVDPNIASLGAFHLGKQMTPDQISKLTKEEKEATVDKYGRVYRRAAAFQRTAAFGNPEALRAYMDKLFEEEEAEYKRTKALLEEAKTDNEAGRSELLARAYNKHCDDVREIREKGMEYFQCIWNQQAQLCPSYKKVIAWYDNHLEGTRQGLMQIPRKNLSIETHKITSNLSHGADMVVRQSAVLEAGLNVINSGENVVQSYTAGLDVWNPEALKCNTMQTSKAGQGKSYLFKILKKLFVPGTWMQLDNFTEKALGTSQQDYDFLRIFVDEFSAGKISGEDYNQGNKGGQSASAAESQKSSMTDMMKTMLAEGKYRYVRLECNPETGQYERKEYETDMRSVWFTLTNSPEKLFRGPFGDRFHINVLMDRERFNTEQLAVRQASTEKGDKTLKASVDAALVLFQRDDCMAAMINLMIVCGCLPEVSTEYGAQFIAYVMNQVDSTHMNTRNSRSRHRALNCLARAYSLNAAVYLILDSPLARHKDEPFEFKQILDIIPHLHVTLDGVIYALGALSGQHENVVLKELVGMIYKRYIEIPPAGKEKAITSANNETQENFDKYFRAEAQARKEGAEKRKAAIAVQSQLIPLPLAPPPPPQQPEAQPNQPIYTSEPLEAGQIYEDAYYYKVKLQRASAFSAAKSQDQQYSFSLASTTVVSPEARAAGWKQPPPRQTPHYQLNALAQQLIQEHGTKGCHESDIYENLKTLANKMTIPSPIADDSTKSYAALAIDSYGILYVSREFVKAYTGQSSLLKHIQNAIRLFHRGAATFLYGRTEANRPTVWQTVKVTEDKEGLPSTVKLFNAMYRSKTDRFIFQDVVDAVSHASGKRSVNVNDAFDSTEYSTCEVGLQVQVAWYRFALRSAISEKQLDELGFDEPPVETYLQKLLLAHTSKKRKLLIYPDDYTGDSKKKKPKRSAGTALMRSCSDTGFASIEKVIEREYGGHDNEMEVIE